MTEGPELRLIKVHWRGENDAGRVETSHFPLTLKPAGAGQWTAESVAYAKVDESEDFGQLAVRAPADGPPPTLHITSRDEWEALRPVRDDDGQTWWIEEGKWDRKKRLYRTKLVNRAGKARFRVGVDEVVVEIAPTELSAQDFQEMLNEFKQGLWGLVLDRNSPASTTVAGPSGGVSEAFRLAVRDLIKSAGNVFRAPHVELREVETWARPDRARPSTRTFQEIARRGAPRLVPNRGHAPTYDTVENRAAATMIERVAEAVEGSMKAVLSRADEFESRSRRSSQRLRELAERPDDVRVPADRLRRDLADVEARFRTWEVAMGRIGARPTSTPSGQELRKTFCIALPSGGRASLCRRTKYGVALKGFLQERSAPGDGRHAFKSVVIDDRHVMIELRIQDITEDRTLSLEDQALLLEDQALLLEDVALVFSGLPHGRVHFDGYVLRRRRVQTDKMDLYVLDLVSMQPLQNRYRGEVVALRRAVTAVDRSGDDEFWRPLRPDEQADRDREVRAHRNDHERYGESGRSWRDLGEELEGLVVGLRAVLRHYATLNVHPERGSEDYAVSSMVYVQNAAYRGVLAAHRAALAASGLEADDVDRLRALDAVGLLDLPTVYERWTLVQLVKTLTEDLHFRTSGVSDILAALTSVQETRTLTVALSCETYGRDVELSYERRFRPEDVHSPRPDYWLTLRRAGGEQDLGEDQNENLREEEDEDLGGTVGPRRSVHERRLIMDAKFKPFRPLYGEGPGTFDLPGQLDELLIKKDYCQQWENRVFVLHPGPEGVRPDDVERYCAFGGEPVATKAVGRREWDRERGELEGRLDHDVGAVLLRPGSRDGLRRLLLMHLYEGLTNTDQAFLSKPDLVPICPTCGGALSGRPKIEYASAPGKPSRAVRAVYKCRTASCGQEVVQTYCANAHCGRHLWKLGPQWNYHMTRPMDPYDVKCPNCETYRPVYIELNDTEEQ